MHFAQRHAGIHQPLADDAHHAAAKLFREALCLMYASDIGAVFGSWVDAGEPQQVHGTHLVRCRAQKIQMCIDRGTQRIGADLVPDIGMQQFQPMLRRMLQHMPQ